MTKRRDKKPVKPTAPAQPMPVPPRRAARPRRGLVGFVVVLAVAGAIGGAAWYFASRASAPAPVLKRVAIATTGHAAGYVGPESCVECHKGISESFSKVAMGHSAGIPTATNSIEDYTTSPEIYHEPSRQYFRMVHEDGKFFQRRYQKDAAGQPINVKQVQADYYIGSGAHVRSFMHKTPEGAMYQLPVAWYSQDKKWAMNPGYDIPDHQGFSRRIGFQCAFCHAAAPALKPGTDQYDLAEDAFFPEGVKSIDCERCHGPAAKHVELTRAKAPAEKLKGSIVNPADLAPERQMDVCMQCHLETTSGKLPAMVMCVGKPTYSFRPGDKLEEYRIDTDHPKGTGHDDKFQIAGQAYRLKMSKCFTESEGRMTCTTCHDPHRVPKDRVAAGIQSCRTCHEPQKNDCIEKVDVRALVQDNCIQCHMPQRRTDDAVHVVMTDHFIQRRREPAEKLLAPRQEPHTDYTGTVALYHPKELPKDLENLYLGIAHVVNGAQAALGAKQLTEYLATGKEVFEAVYARATAYRTLNELDKAEADLKRAAQMDPEHPNLWLSLGDVYRRMGRGGEAVAAYEESLKRRPWFSSAHNGLGAARLMAGDLAGAAAAFTEAAKQDPFDSKSLVNLANALARQGKFDEAEKAAREALELDPSSAETWLPLAQILLDTKLPADAAEAAAQSVLWEPRAEGVQVLAKALSQLPAEQMGAAADRAAAHAPFVAHSLAVFLEIDRGVAPAVNPRLAQIVEAPTSGVVELVEVLGNSQPAEDLIAAISEGLQEAGREAESLQMLQASHRVSPQSARTMNSLGWLLATARKAELRSGAEAERLAQAAIQAMGGRENVPVLQTLAAALADQGKFEAAAGHAERALKMAEEAGNADLAQQAQQQLTAYQAGRTWP